MSISAVMGSHGFRDRSIQVETNSEFIVGAPARIASVLRGEGARSRIRLFAAARAAGVGRASAHAAASVTAMVAAAFRDGARTIGAVQA
jgi:hypothetical protein